MKRSNNYFKYSLLDNITNMATTVQKSTDGGTNWPEITTGVITDISISPPSSVDNQNMKIYGLGDSAFASKMKSEGKIETTNNFYNIYDDKPVFIYVKVKDDGTAGSNNNNVIVQKV